MFHKKPQVYVRPQRGRISATSRGGVLFDPYRVGDASFPFFSGTWNSLGICIDRLTLPLFIHSTQPRWGLLFFGHFSVPTQLIFFCKESEGFSCYKTSNIIILDPRGVVCLQPPRAVVYSTLTGSGMLPFLFFWNVEFLRNLF